MLNDILLIENQKKLCPIVVQLFNIEKKKEKKNKGEKSDNETEKMC